MKSWFFVISLSLFLLSACGGEGYTDIDSDSNDGDDTDTSENIDSNNRQISILNNDNNNDDEEPIIDDEVDADEDSDNDTIPDTLDNCPNIANIDQADANDNNMGDACDSSDSDGDNVPDNEDQFPEDATKAASITNAHRLLTQATFGPTEAEIDNIVAIGAQAWLTEQFAKPSAYDNSADDHKTHLERTVEITNLEEPSITWTNNGIFNTSPAAIWNVRYYQMSAWWENALI